MSRDEKPIRPMLPTRHKPSLFSLDINSISLKDTQQHLEFPFFSLSKKPDLRPRRYEDAQGNRLEVSAHSKGLPTIYDKDFLVYAISVIMDRLNRGEPASRRLILYASDMLEFANRTKSGRDYMALDDAITRLRGCTIKTNIRTGDIYTTSVFGMIERGDLIRKYGFDGRLQHVEVTLSEWLWDAIRERHVLTLHPDYFRLRQPLERRLYENPGSGLIILLPLQPRDFRPRFRDPLLDFFLGMAGPFHPDSLGEVSRRIRARPLDLYW